MGNPNKQPDAALDSKAEAKTEAVDTAANLPPANPDAPKGAAAENTEHFIDRHVLHNDGLTPAAKEFLVNIARSGDGAWRKQDGVVKVTQEEGTITVESKGGSQAYFYIPGLPHPQPKIVPRAAESESKVSRRLPPGFDFTDPRNITRARKRGFKV